MARGDTPQLDMSVEQTGPSIAELEKQSKNAIMARLRQLGGAEVTEATGVRYHAETFIALPQRYKGHPDAAVSLLEKHMKSESKPHAFSKTFKFRPWDGAVAMQRALMKTFGTAGMGMTIQHMFGSEPPELISLEVGLNETTQVPWGRLEFPPLEGVIDLGGAYDKELGPLFNVTFTVPKKFRGEVEGLFAVIQDELETGSIYRGKAITGAEMPTFIDTSVVKREHVVYASDVEHTLQAEVWNRIEHTDLFREDGNPLKRSVLLAGPYGTGKSLTAVVTGAIAEANDWTFIQCRPGQDDLQLVMQTAMLYQPAVVFYEDIDQLTDASEQDAGDVSKILELFDGVRSKGTELIVMMTTNHEGKIHKGMLRSGRLDTLVRIEGLDKVGLEKLIRVIVKPEQLAGDIDFNAVWAACEDYEPAFMRAVIDGARTDALGRTKSREYLLTTDDLVHAAERLRPQWLLMRDAEEHAPRPAITTALEELIGTVLRGHNVGERFAIVEGSLGE